MSMQLFQQASFLTSAANVSQAPPDRGFEIAFCGRSNAGKSSALNRLTQQKRLARTSRTPGRTQLINFFALDDDRRLVDLPGYGYAKVPQSLKQFWQQHLDHYLRSRSSLIGLVLLVDSRHEPKPFDLAMIDWAKTAGLHLHVLLTKADKLSKNQSQHALFRFQRESSAVGSSQLFSATSGLGLDELRGTLSGWFQTAIDSSGQDAV
ncbi:MAG: ribosome biogenesis GTP-binding protein YihA/YsxC [Pseudomonadales bacterium]